VLGALEWLGSEYIISTSELRPYIDFNKTALIRPCLREGCRGANDLDTMMTISLDST